MESASPLPPLDVDQIFSPLPESDAPLRWIELFGDEGPVEIEVGPGKGLFLAKASGLRPDHRFIGVEIAKKYARKAAERLAKLHRTNVRMYSGDARRLFRDLVPAESVRAVHVYFPDPWWKKRHKKRRVFDEWFLGQVARVLGQPGELHVATDVEEYFGVMKETVATDPRFVEQPFPTLIDPVDGTDYLTNFERKYRIEGRPIYRTSYRFVRENTTGSGPIG